MKRSGTSGRPLLTKYKKRGRQQLEFGQRYYPNRRGKVSEDGTTQLVTIDLPNEIVEAMNLEAERLKMSVPEYIEFLVRGAK